MKNNRRTSSCSRILRKPPQCLRRRSSHRLAVPIEPDSHGVRRIEAEQVYALLRARKASAYRIDAVDNPQANGCRSCSRFPHAASGLAWEAVVGTLAVATLVVGAVGFLAMNQINSHAKSIYEDRAVPLAQRWTNDRMKDNSLALYGAIANDTVPAGRSGRSYGRIAANIEAIGKSWSDYMATYLHARGEGRWPRKSAEARRTCQRAEGASPAHLLADKQM